MSSRIKITYPDADGNEIALHARHFERLRTFADLEIYVGRPGSTREYLHRVAHAQGILLGWDLPGDVMRSAENLEVISFSGVGADKFVDMDQARERNITVCNCPGYSDITVGEHTLALLLSVCRQLPRLNRELKSGIWDQSTDLVELHGKKIGLIGFGGIGKHVARLCNAFGMNVHVWTRSMNPDLETRYDITLCTLEELYASCPIVSLHLASNEETHGIIDPAALQSMQPGSILINTARAELVQEEALIESLQSGHLAAAGIDVFHQEPLPFDHPFASMDNIIVTPHVAYHTAQAVDRLFEIAVDNLESYFNGKPMNVVN